MQKLLLPFARRFVAGDNTADALKAVVDLNQRKVVATLDVLGEDVTDEKQADGAVADYLDLLDQIENQKIQANVSLKLSQMGLCIRKELALKNLIKVLDRAKQYGNTVRIDMEGSSLTDDTLEVYYQAKAQYPNVGIVLQAYLHRTQDDVAKVIRESGSLRLCKGGLQRTGRTSLPKYGRHS